MTAVSVISLLQVGQAGEMGGTFLEGTSDLGMGVLPEILGATVAVVVPVGS